MKYCSTTMAGFMGPQLHQSLHDAESQVTASNAGKEPNAQQYFLQRLSMWQERKHRPCMIYMMHGMAMACGSVATAVNAGLYGIVTRQFACLCMHKLYYSYHGMIDVADGHAI